MVRGARLNATPLDTEVAIETPEHIVFHYRIAGPARRALAHLLDLLLCYLAVAIFALFVLLAAMGGAIKTGEITAAAKAGIGLILLALFAAQWIYFVVWESLCGRSPGKMAVGVRVVTTSGRPIGWRAAALRNLLRAADLLPVAYLTGVFSMMVSSRFQRLGDLVAGTMVVAPLENRFAHALELAPPPDPRELASLPEHITLDAEERVAIEMFLRRRHTLGVTRETELAAMIAGQIGERIGYTHPDPSRLLALVYDRAVNAGRTESPPSLRPPA
jgi:uncharacterized RDD family membrane protein YckC